VHVAVDLRLREDGKGWTLALRTAIRARDGPHNGLA